MLDVRTVADVYDWYDKNAPDRANVGPAAVERRRLRKRFAAWMQDKPLAAAAPYQLLEFINDHAGENCWTRKRWNTTLQAPLNFACKLGLIEWNPFKGLTFPQGKNGRDWTDDEYRKLMRGAPAYVRRFLVMLRFSGMRPGEVRKLEWKHLASADGLIILTEHKTAYRTGKPRIIPLNHVTTKLLAWIRLNTIYSRRHVFLNSHFLPWSRCAITKQIRKIREEVGIPNDVKCHGGRHMFCTRAIMNGVDVATLAELVGHNSIETTQRYVHLAEKGPHLKGAMEQAVGGSHGRKTT
jgi:integrase